MRCCQNGRAEGIGADRHPIELFERDWTDETSCVSSDESVCCETEMVYRRGCTERRERSWEMWANSSGVLREIRVLV